MNPNSESVVAQRSLVALVDGATAAVHVKIYAPRPEGENWACIYEIGWPSATRRVQANGLDSVQALLLAMQMIGAELYARRPSGVSDLYWLEAGDGVGFPLPPSLRGQALGEDRQL